MIPGLTVKVTSSGIPIFRLHYSASIRKRPGTELGDTWIAKESRKYGGTNSPRWRKEQEIDYGALGGTRLFPQWEQWSTNGKIIIPPFDPVGYRLYGSYDHGWRNPACYHVHGINSDGDIVTLFEFYDSHVPYTYIARIIKGEDVVVPVQGCCEIHRLSRYFRGNPYAGKERWKRADPSIWAQDQPQRDGTNKSTAYLFSREGIHFQRAERGTDTTIAEWLLGYYWKDLERPLYRITTDCPKLIWEIGQQRHREFSAHVALNRDQPEELIDKDNHAWDSLKYFFQRFPPKTPIKGDPKLPNTFDWWQKLSEGKIERTSFRI